MGYTGMTIFRLTVAAMLPVIVAAIFYQAEKSSRKYQKLSNRWKQLIVGLCFGALAILATEVGIPADGAVLNVRNAAPLTAGLIFGWPSGLIAGLIGGVERWFSNAGDYTRLACSIATIVAGVFGAGVRKFMMDNKKASWFYGLVVGVTTEVLHMLLVFLTNAGDIQRAFRIVQICAIPMIVSNGVSVMMAIVVITIMAKRGARHEADGDVNKENISQTFQRWLLVSVVVAFAVTTLCSHMFQTQIANAVADFTLKASVEDLRNDINDVSDRNLLKLARRISAEITDDMSQSDLFRLAQKSGVTEISIIDKNGIIMMSSDYEIIGFDMSSGAQAAEFLVLLDGTKEFVQQYQPITRDENIYRKYAGIALEEGFLQVGYDSTRFYAQIHEQVKYAAENRRIGQNGFMIICDENGTIVSDREGHQGENVSIFGEGRADIEPMARVSTEIYGVPSFAMYTESEGYCIIGVLSQEEALFSKNASVYMLAFMETLVFAALFANIFVLIKKLVVKNIRKINESLALITNGNLNVTVDVRDNEEFASLSDDINSTVSALKHYIDEAAARFDKDLEIAKKIQHSALPSVFPPYPTRKDFSIFASMDAAKEVGGDFYDFYLLDENHLAFVVADVSGKGIPGAMFMMTSKTLIKSHAESGLPVNDVFTQVNAQLCENNEAGMFVTAWMGILDIETGLIRYANAGHNPPVVRHKDGSYEYVKGRANFVLAGMEGVRYKEQQLQLQPGDEIYLYTDGVTEAHDAEKQLFGEDRLLDSLNATDGMTVDEICRKVKSDVDAFVGEAEQFDDITMMCVRLNVMENKVLTVTPTMESVPQVAAFVEEQLESFEVPMKLTMKLMVAVDEIYSNIVRYSGATDAQVRIAREEELLRLTFSDNGKPYDPLEAKEPDITAAAEDRAIGGLGIFMVRKMMDAVEYEYTQGRNKLTLTMNLQPGEKV